MFRKVAVMFMATAIISSLAVVSSAEAAPSGVTWPKNVEIVVPSSAGGDSDYNARLLANELSKRLSPNFVVANVGGNGGATGTRRVKNAKKDGGTILFHHSGLVVNQLSGTTDYGFEAYDFACIAALNPGDIVTVNSKLGIKTLAELLAYTKAHPDELKMAAQTGATSFAVSVLMKQAGFNFNIVDAGSAADRLTALLGGHVDIIIAPYGSIKDYVAEGTFTPLASVGAQDFKAAKVKNLVSQGYNVKLPFYYFFAFPKGTNQALIDEFTATVKDIVENDKKYQGAIAAAYYQAPTFYNAADGLAKFNEVYSILKNVQFK